MPAAIWFVVGLFAGGFVGFMAAALCFTASLASRCEECRLFGKPPGSPSGKRRGA